MASCSTPREVLRKYWGYDDFRPLQADIIESVLAGHDTLGLLPTGGGKSLTFQVPAMLLEGLTIVITPLISLMKDQVDNLLSHGIRAYCLHSGLTRAESNLVADRCRLGKTKILYVSPERLQSDAFILLLHELKVSLVVVDEAHCISQWGYDFRPSYLKIRTIRDLFPHVPVLALTATATPRVADDIREQLAFRPGHNSFVKSFTRPNISFVARCDDFKERTLVRVLRSTEGSAIVYVRSRRRCGELARLLQSEGISASYYHAGLDPADKAERQNLWKSGQVRVMVATNAFGMGIDKADVRVVAHFDLPSSLEEYYQEAGRAGRDGLPSYAVVIASKSDKALLSRRLSDSFPAKDYIKRVYELAGVFLDVAVGEGYQQVHEFNFSEFCQRYGLQPVMAHSALQILTRAQYVEYVDEIELRSRVMILASKHEFYSLQLDVVTDNVFNALQRQYTGLFADYVHIDESVIARRAEVTMEQTYQALLLLARMKVISYIPKKSTPYLCFTTSREEPRYVTIPKAVYEDRKKCMEDRIRAMKAFVYDDEKCRVQTMLEYFGETGAEPCGTCDVCRRRKQKGATRAQAASLEQTIASLAACPGGCTIEHAAAYASASRESVIEAVRSLADKGLVAFRDGVILSAM